MERKLFLKGISGYLDSDQTRNEYLELAKKCQAEKIILFVSRPYDQGEPTDQVLEQAKINVEFLQKNGYEVIIWCNTIGMRNWLAGKDKQLTQSYTKLKSIRGCTHDIAGFCPTDKNFSEYIFGYIKKLAKLKPQGILLDDDFCLSVSPGMDCACDNHLEEFKKRTGDYSINIENLEDKILYSKDKTLRKIWLELQGDTLRDFAKGIRKAIDCVDANIRCGFCAGFTSWDFEGVSVIELSKILAGNTGPFLRFAGAPYWVPVNRNEWKMKLQDVIEYTRAQIHWCKNSGIEIFDENDNCPGFRTQTPIAYNEGFDLALTVDGKANTLRYLFQHPSYFTDENGYIAAFERNAGLRKRISELCSQKTDGGIEVLEYIDKIWDYDFDKRVVDMFPEELHPQTLSFSRAESMLSRVGIPITYSNGDNAVIVFGQNAKYVELDVACRGMILDFDAAKILQERGLDIGIESYDEVFNLPAEIFGEQRFNLYNGGKYYHARLNKNARVLSEFVYGDKNIPACFRYENALGQRFLVYCFDSYSVGFGSNLFSNYQRGKQLRDNIAWLNKPLIVSVADNTFNLYAMQKNGADESVFVGLFNFTPDEIYSLKLNVLQTEGFSTVIPVNCQLTYKDGVITVDYFKAYGFVGFELRK